MPISESRRLCRNSVRHLANAGQVPFCGNGLEIKGLIWALHDLLPNLALAVNFSDINAQSLANAQILYSNFPLPSIRASNLAIAKFSRIDLVNSELPRADLVIAVHPQLFDAGRTIASDPWIRIIRNVARNSRDIIFFLIAPFEAKAIIKLLSGTHSIRSFNNPHSFTMPREVISNARAARRGDPSTFRHRYYNTILLAKRAQD
jgi:hypothetical protein